MVWNRVWACAALVAAVLPPVQAAEPKAPEGKSADPKSDSAEAAAAMERARRQATNPLRVILEASKLRRRDGEAVPVAASVSVPTALPSAATPKPAAAAPAQTVPSTVTLESKLSAPAAFVPGLPGSEGEETLSVQPAASTPALVQSLTPTAVQPKLREMVEPSIPPRVLDEIGSLALVQADLTLRADGSVASVVLVQPVPRQVVRYLTAALERWRYEPLPAEQVHRVRLVFNEQP